MTIVRHSSYFDCSPEALFEFHRDVNNLGRMAMPGQKFELLSEPKTTEQGDIQRLAFGSGPLRMNWVAEFRRVEPPKVLEDWQISGPFRKWRHQHKVTPEGDGARLTDTVSFRLLPTVVGEFVEYWTVRPALQLMFLWRHRKTRVLLGEPVVVSGEG